MLFHDLDQGLRPINVFIQNFPNPTYHKRDEAHRELTNLFLEVLRERKSRNLKDDDVVQVFIDAIYRDGTEVRYTLFFH